MAEITKTALVDEIIGWATKLNRTDDSLLDPDFLGFVVDKVRADLIVRQYLKTKTIDPTWLTDLGLVSFNNVNMADEASLTFCGSCISKTTVPQTISLIHPNGNLDLGIYAVMSACGKTKYFSKPLTTWSMIDENHTYSHYNYFARINSAMYVNKKIDYLRIIAILQNPNDGVFKQSDIIASGSISTGIVYIVKDNQVIYNGIIRAKGTTFTGVAGVTTYNGSGKVYLNSQARVYASTDPYPVSGDMARAIVTEILTKEFGIEKGQLTDEKNDSSDPSTEDKKG